MGSGAKAGKLKLGLLPLAAAALLALLLFAPAGAAAGVRPPEGLFGSAAQPSFSEPEGIAVDQSSGDVLVIDAHQANEKRELKIEASSGLGGTYKLEVGGQSSGWSGTGTLEGESGTGNLSGFEGKGKTQAGSNLVTELTATTGALAVGHRIEGNGIPAGATVLSCSPSCASPTSLTMSANANFSIAGVTLRVGTLTVSNFSGGPFLAGQAITGPGIQSNTTIASLGAGTLTLSKVPTDTATGAALVAGSTTVGGLSGAVGHLSVGLLVSGPGIQAGTTIASVGAGEASFTLSKPPSSSGSVALSADLAFSAGEFAVQAALEKLSPLAPGSVKVEGFGSTSPVTRTLEFKGRLAGAAFPVACDGSGLTGTGHSCTVTQTQAPVPATLSRWHSDGTPAPFAALGTNVIDAKGAGHGPGSGGSCVPVSLECDETPQNRFEFGPPGQVQVAVDSSGSATDGDIYVAQGHFSNVSDELGNVAIFSADGEYLGELAVPPLPTPPGGVKDPCGVAVDGGGSLFFSNFANNGNSRVYEYSPTANPPQESDLSGEYEPFPERFPKWGLGSCALAAGAGPTAGFLFAAVASSTTNTVFKIDLADGSFGFSGSPITTGATTVSLDPATGKLYIAEGEGLSSTPPNTTSRAANRKRKSKSSPATPSTASP